MHLLRIRPQEHEFLYKEACMTQRTHGPITMTPQIVHHQGSTLIILTSINVDELSEHVQRF